MAAAASAAPPPSFAALPKALLMHFLALLPVDARARCATVCPAWRGAADEPSLWRALDASASSGVAAAQVTPALLRGAAAKARGTLVSLDVTDRADQVGIHALLAVLSANAATLRELRVSDPGLFFSTAEIKQLLTAAPHLKLLEADLRDALPTVVHDMQHADATRLAPLRLHRMFLDSGTGYAAVRDANVVALGAALAQRVPHWTPRELVLHDIWLGAPGVMDALADGAIACSLPAFTALACSPHVAAPALARLLRSPALRELSMHENTVAGEDQMHYTEEAAVLLAQSLRSDTSALTRLDVHCHDLWDEPAAGDALLAALVAHPSLHTLCLGCSYFQSSHHEAFAGRAFAALVAANAPALHTLRLRPCALDDADWAPLFASLPRNAHLRLLECDTSGVSNAFAEDVVLPAVHANTSLREPAFYARRRAADTDPDSTAWQQPGVDVLTRAERLVRHRARG
jgi:hypothetical protein